MDSDDAWVVWLPAVEARGGSMKRYLLAALVPLAAAALAQGRPGVQSIIVNPAPGPLTVRTWVDRDPSKVGNPVYAVGESLQVSVQVSLDAYVYLFEVRATGQINLIYPNPYDGGNFVSANQVRTIPGFGARYRFTVDYPPGRTGCSPSPA
jgi:hypothetical protein